MGTQIAVRLDETELATLDAEVAEGRAVNRSDAVRQAVARLERAQRYRRDDAVLVPLAAAGESVYPELEGMHHLDLPPLD